MLRAPDSAFDYKGGRMSMRLRMASMLALVPLSCWWMMGGAYSSGSFDDTNSAPLLAPRPPLGWNSWDGYGTTINEEQVKANAEWFAKHLKPFGWEYIVVDMEWFVTNPVAEGNSKTAEYS